MDDQLVKLECLRIAGGILPRAQEVFEWVTKPKGETVARADENPRDMRQVVVEALAACQRLIEAERLLDSTRHGAGRCPPRADRGN
jgi:hypothetical protein